MYRKSREYTEPDIFTGSSQLLSSQKLKIMDSNNHWHNIFFKEITSSINENVFKVLYPSNTGRPNSPLRILVAMQVLKEGFNWSDEQLFNECRFDLLVMRALGLTNLNDEIPAASTYYDFKARLTKYQQQTGEDLFTMAFYELTRAQAKTFNVNGSKVRMDSKLISSNIAACTRLQLVIGILQKFYKSLSEKDKKKIMKKHRITLEGLLEKDAQSYVYPLSNKDKILRLKNFGKVYRYLLQKFNSTDSSEYDHLFRLYDEQYQESQKEITPKPRQEIKGNTLQSPHDDQATYRYKDSGQKKQSIRGYVSNITETCGHQLINLITNIQTATATTSDDYFFQSAIENSEQVTGQIKKAWTDGAYNSVDNLDFVQSRNQSLEWYLNAIQGEKGLYEFEWVGSDLMVKDLRTSKTQKALKTTKGKYRINNTPGNKDKYRYFEPRTVANYFRRLEIEAQPDDIKNVRPNVESTIHHVFYHLNGAKSKYRGLTRNHMFIISRGIWVNFRRIQKYVNGKPFRVALETIFLENVSVKILKNALLEIILMILGLFVFYFKNEKVQLIEMRN
ncbi:transposase [candidate division WOR-3 bacterium]|nr:transposase [candidate division WOR-3 bacterium]